MWPWKTRIKRQGSRLGTWSEARMGFKPWFFSWRNMNELYDCHNGRWESDRGKLVLNCSKELLWAWLSSAGRPHICARAGSFPVALVKRSLLWGRTICWTWCSRSCGRQQAGTGWGYQGTGEFLYGFNMKIFHRCCSYAHTDSRAKVIDEGRDHQNFASWAE